MFKFSEVRTLFSKPKRLLLIPVAAFAFFLFVSLIWNLVAGGQAKKWDAEQPRDAETGILIGAEPLDLGPKDSPTAVLLVHGFIGATSNFGDLPQQLADAGYHVKAIRLPGHGTTPFDLIHTEGDEIVDAVVLEIHSLRETHEKVFLVAHSMGGAISTIAASQTEVDGLVLGAPYFQVTRQWYYLLPPEAWSALTRWAVKWTLKSDNFIRVKRAEAKKDIVSYRWVPSIANKVSGDLAAQARNPETLQAITAPLLILHSRDDFAASPKASGRAFEKFTSPEKTIQWLENSDHHIFRDYDREQVIQATLDFIERHSDD